MQISIAPFPYSPMALYNLEEKDNLKIYSWVVLKIKNLDVRKVIKIRMISKNEETKLDYRPD